MDEAQFWSLIEQSSAQARGDQLKQYAALKKFLKRLPAEEIAAFQHHLDRKVAHAEDWNLWGAAYLINGGCSDDGFVYFRLWLISKGQRCYQAALENPDSLAGIVDPETESDEDHEFEMLLSPAPEVYQELTGQDAPDDPDFRWPSEPRGTEWDFDDTAEMTRRFPRLSALYA